jgi:hypothetical protein
MHEKNLLLRKKVVVSLIKTVAPLKVARHITDKIEKNIENEIKTSDIKKSELYNLKLHNPILLKHWYKYMIKM